MSIERIDSRIDCSTCVATCSLDVLRVDDEHGLREARGAANRVLNVEMKLREFS